MRKGFLIAAMLAVCVTVSGAEAGRTIMVLDVSCRGVEMNDHVAQVDVNLSDLVKAQKPTDRIEIRPDMIRVVEVDSKGAPMGETVSQFDSDSTFDPKENAKGTLLWLVKGRLSPKQTRRFAVIVDSARKGATAPGVTVSGAVDAITVENDHYKVVHLKKANGGLIKEITFKQSGKCDKDLTLNDRLHDKNTNCGYSLRNDAAPKVRVASSGPLRTVIETAARHLSGEGKSNDARPSAVYRFCYMAGSPTVQVDADVRQETSFGWSELHFLELYHKAPFFPKWILGPNGETAEFTTKVVNEVKEKERKKGFNGSGWGALFGNGAALGLAAPGGLIVYDGASDYGTYLHGPWVHGWADTHWRAQAHLYLGSDAGAPDSIRQWAEKISAPPGVSIEVPGLRAEIADAMKGSQSSISRWRVARAAADIRAGRDVLQAAKVIRAAAQESGGFRLFAPKVETLETEDNVFVSNGMIGLGFSRQGDGTGLMSIYDFRHGKDLLPSGKTGKLWKIALKNKAGETVTVANTDVLTTPEIRVSSKPFDDSRTVEMIWQALSLPEEKGVISVTTTATVDPDSPLTRWRIDVKNEIGEFGLWEVEFPIISNIDGRTDADPQESVAYPDGWGVLDPTPRSSLRWRPMYPSGSCAMQFAAYRSGPDASAGTGGSGLYYAAHDGAAYTKTMNLQGADPTSGITFSCIQYPPDMLKPGVGYAQPYDVMVGVFDGDWYDAARIYRKWVLRQTWCSYGPLCERKDIPDIFKELAMWGRTRANPEDARVDNAKFKERFQVAMANHWYCWHVIPFDDNYPEYFPAKPGFKEAVAEAQKLPVWQMPYINGRLWDTDTESFKQIGHKYCTKDEKMEPYIEVYGSKQKLAPMCVHTRCWQDKVNEIVWKLIDEYGLNGVYIDQVGAAAPRLCMDESHGHPLGGGKWWVEGYWKMLSEMKKRMKAKHPDSFLTTESNAEPYMQYFDGYLMCNSTRDRLIPLFSAVYHDYNLTFGRYVFANDLKVENAYYMKMGEHFAFGAQLAWIPSDILNDACKEGADYLAHLARLRAQSLKYLAFGEMLRPLTFTNDIPLAKSQYAPWGHPRPVEMSAIQSSVWRAPDGSVGLVFTNVLKEAITVSYDFDTVAYGLPKAGEYVISEITESGEKEIGRAKAGKFSRTERIEGHKGLVLSVKPA